MGINLISSCHIETVVKMSNQQYKPDSCVKMELDAEDYYRIKDEGESRLFDISYTFEEAGSLSLLRYKGKEEE